MPRQAGSCRSCRTLCALATHMKAACSLPAEAVARYHAREGRSFAAVAVAPRAGLPSLPACGVAVRSGVQVCVAAERARFMQAAMRARKVVSARGEALAVAVLLQPTQRYGRRGRHCCVRAGLASSYAAVRRERAFVVRLRITTPSSGQPSAAAHVER